MSIPRDFNRQPPPIHPGQMLFEEFMKPLSLDSVTLARELHVPEERISQLVEGTAELDGDMSYRLSIYFNMSVYFWTNLQTQYQLSLVYRDQVARMQQEIQPRIAA